MCAYQRVRNVSFSENVCYALNGWPQGSEKLFDRRKTSTLSNWIIYKTYSLSTKWCYENWKLNKNVEERTSDISVHKCLQIFQDKGIEISDIAT